jgi:hypothetical protein
MYCRLTVGEVLRSKLNYLILQLKGKKTKESQWIIQGYKVCHYCWNRKLRPDHLTIVVQGPLYHYRVLCNV